MDWIKKNYDRFVLAIFALALLASSGWLIYSALNFKQTFASLQQTVAHNNKVSGQSLDEIDKARASIQKPATWVPQKDTGSLFVSERYLVKEGKLVALIGDANSQLHKPVPNQWFLDNNLDIQDPDILNQDTDHNGFTNYEKWKAGIDPNDPNAHPPYNTKLRLKQFIQKPFRLKFNGYNGDPKKPETLEFQIDTVDVKQPTQFKKLGETIDRTNFKIEKFEYKSFQDSNGIDHETSELTVKNDEEGKEVVLIYQKVVNSPDSYGFLKYLWNGDEITVRKDKSFNIKPTNEEYKLIDINDTEAVIESTKGEKIKIPRLDEHDPH